MARKKKDGTRGRGIQSKKGNLYIVITKQVVENGKLKSKNFWKPTGLKDTPENVEEARRLREIMENKNTDLPMDPNINMEEMGERYLSIIKRTVSDTTYSGYEARCKRIKDFFGETKVRDIRVSQVELFLDYLITEKGNSPRTVKDTKVTFASVMEEAVKSGVILDNPAKKATINKSLVDKYEGKPAGDDFFLEDDAMLFLDILKREKRFNHLWPIFYIALFYGMRREEVLGLKWSNIDFGRKEFYVRHTVTKGTRINRQDTTKTIASARKYPLGDELIRELEKIREKQKSVNLYDDHGYVFISKYKKPYYPDSLTRAFKRVIKSHPELPQNITLHGLRKSAASILAHRGYDVKSIQDWLGQKDVQTTLTVYTKVKSEESKKAILENLHQVFKDDHTT